MQGFNDDNIKNILVVRGFDSSRFMWIKNKDQIQLLSDSELLLVAWVFDKYCNTDNLFGLGRGDNLSCQSVDYNIIGTDQSQINTDYIIDCSVIGNCIVGYIPLYVLSNKLNNNDSLIKTPINYKTFLDISNVKNVYSDKLDIIKFYTQEKLTIDKHKRLKIDNLYLSMDSIYSFILLKNNISDKNYKIPVLVIYNDEKDKYSSYRSFQDKIKENIVNDIKVLFCNEVSDLPYDLNKCCKAIFTYLQNCKSQNYDDVIKNIYYLMLNKKLSAPIFSTAELNNNLNLR